MGFVARNLDFERARPEFAANGIQRFGLPPFHLKVPVMKSSLLLIAIALSGSLFAQQTQSLRVMVDRIPEGAAPTVVMLYGPGTQFLNDDAPVVAKMQIAAGETRGSLEFQELVSGKDYAVLAFQDLNGNGLLDRKNGRPSESYVFTETGEFIGTPSFSDVSFRLSPETSAVLLNMVAVKNRAKEATESLSSR